MTHHYHYMIYAYPIFKFLENNKFSNFYMYLNTLPVPITFDDAPEYQFAVKGTDSKVKCSVKADPPPIVSSI